MILLKICNCPPQGITDGMNTLDVVTLSFISALIVFVFIFTKVKKVRFGTSQSLNQDILGQEKGIPENSDYKLPFTDFSNKKAYLLILSIIIGLVMIFGALA